MTEKEYTNCVAQCAEDVMRFALRCNNCREDCEDAIQDALESLWRHRSAVEAPKGKQYLVGATYRRLMSAFRHTAVVQDYAAEVQATTPEGYAPNTQFDLREAIDQSLQALPQVQRAILQLRDVEGYSYAEIAESLELNDKQVQVYLFRARVAMRRELTRLGYDNHQ